MIIGVARFLPCAHFLLALLSLAPHQVLSPERGNKIRPRAGFQREEVGSVPASLFLRQVFRAPTAPLLARPDASGPDLASLMRTPLSHVLRLQGHNWGRCSVTFTGARPSQGADRSRHDCPPQPCLVLSPLLIKRRRCLGLSCSSVGCGSYF